MANCLLEDSGIDHTTLHLKQTDCTGTFDSMTNMVTFHFDDSSNTCGTEVSVGALLGLQNSGIFKVETFHEK